MRARKVRMVMVVVVVVGRVLSSSRRRGSSSSSQSLYSRSHSRRDRSSRSSKCQGLTRMEVLRSPGGVGSCFGRSGMGISRAVVRVKIALTVVGKSRLGGKRSRIERWLTRLQSCPSKRSQRR